MIKINLLFFIIANPVGCWGAGPSVQRAAAEPAEQTWASDRHQTHTVIENSCCTDEMQTNCTETGEYFCTFCTTSSAYLSWCTLSLFIFIALHFSGLHLQTCVVSAIFHNYYWTLWSESVISDFRESDRMIVSVQRVSGRASYSWMFITWFKDHQITVFSTFFEGNGSNGQAVIRFHFMQWGCLYKHFWVVDLSSIYYVL